MDVKKATGCALVVVLVSTSMQSFANEPPRNRDQVDRASQIDRASQMDRDRVQDRTRVDTPDRDRDRLRTQDYSKLDNREIYGNELLSRRERSQYRLNLAKAENSEAREQYRAEHQAEMRARAEAKGIQLNPTSEGPLFGDRLMTAEERNEHRAKMRAMDSSDDRREYMAQHREEMQTRAQRQGVEIEESEEIEDAE